MTTPRKKPGSAEGEQTDCIDELLVWCRRIGRDRRIVQGSGGNVSLKDGPIMHVKASGWTFSSMRRPDGFSVLRHSDLSDYFSGGKAGARTSESTYIALLGESLKEGSPKPSIESAMHALLGAVVCHTHPNAVLSVLCRRGAQGHLAGIMREIGTPWILVPYANPGAALASKIVRTARDSGLDLKTQPLALFLKNHGLVTVGRNVDEAFGLTRRIIEGLEAARKKRPVRTAATSAKRKAADIVPKRRLVSILNAFDGGEGVWRAADAALAERTCRVVQKRLLKEGGILFPDQAVYCGRGALVLEGRSERVWKKAWNDYVCRFGTAPATALHCDGMLAFRSSSDTHFKTQLETWECVVEVCESSCGEPVFIPDRDMPVLMGSEMERDRRRRVML